MSTLQNNNSNNTHLNSNIKNSNLTLTKNQYQNIIENIVNESGGLNSVLEMTLNALMKSERSEFLNNNFINSNSSSNPTKNKANGYRLGSVSGQEKSLSLKIPRDRLSLFKPIITAIYRSQTELLEELSFDLYGYGLTTNDIGKTLGKIYGNSLSSSSISRINLKFQKEMETWRKRSLEKFYPTLFIDCTFIKTKRGEGVGAVSSEAYYIVLAVKDDLTREVIGIYNNPTEGAELWSEIFKDLKARGLVFTNLIVADGLTGLEDIIGREFKQAKFQKCVTHLKRNILRKVKPRDKENIASDLKTVFDLTKDQEMGKEEMGKERREKVENQYISSLNSNLSFEKNLKSAKKRLNQFIEKWGRFYPHISKLNSKVDIDYYFTYLRYNPKVRNMIYTTNWIERLNKSFKKSIKIRNSMPSPESTLCLLSKISIDMNQSTYSYKVSNFKFDQNLITNNFKINNKSN